MAVYCFAAYFFQILHSIVFFSLAFVFYIVRREVRTETFSFQKWLFAAVILITDFVMFNQTHIPLIVLVVLETAYDDVCIFSLLYGWKNLESKFVPRVKEDYLNN